MRSGQNENTYPESGALFAAAVYSNSHRNLAASAAQLGTSSSQKRVWSDSGVSQSSYYEAFGF